MGAPALTGLLKQQAAMLDKLSGESQRINASLGKLQSSMDSASPADRLAIGDAIGDLALLVGAAGRAV
jgi:hypothetical protein